MAVAEFSGLSPLNASNPKRKKKSRHHKKKGHKKNSHHTKKRSAAALLRAVAHTQGVRAGNNGGISIDPNSPWTKIFREIYSERTVSRPKGRKGQQRGSGGLSDLLGTVGGLINAVPQIAIGLLGKILG